MIHGTIEEMRRNSVRGFLCDGNGCRRILHDVISSLAMSELATARHNRRLDGGFRRARPLKLPRSFFWNFVGRFFLVRSICATNFSRPILVHRNRGLSRFLVCLSY